MDCDNTQILFGFGRIATALRAGEWQAAGGHGLVPAQAKILSRIVEAPLRAADIAAHLGVSPASASDSIAALVAKGLARREPDPADGRARLLTATDEGARVAQALAAMPTPLAGALDTLSIGDRGGLLRALTILIRALQEARAIPVQRMCATCRHFHPNAHPDAAKPHHCTFVNAAFGDADLRLDCGEHKQASANETAALWQRFDAA